MIVDVTMAMTVKAISNRTIIERTMTVLLVSSVMFMMIVIFRMIRHAFTLLSALFLDASVLLMRHLQCPRRWIRKPHYGAKRFISH